MDLIKTAAGIAGVAEKAINGVKRLIVKYDTMKGMSGEEKRLAVKRLSAQWLPGVPGFIVDTVIQVVLAAVRSAAGKA